MLRFSELLHGQVQNEIPYSVLKNLLRALSSNHPLYPRSSAAALSQSQTQTPGHSQLSLPFSTLNNPHDKPNSGDTDLQPRTLFPHSENPAQTPQSSLELHPEESGPNAKGGQHLTSDAEEELQLLLQQVGDATILTSRHAYLIGCLINSIVQYLAEQMRLDDNSGEITLRDIAKFCSDKSDPVYDFLEAMYLRNFKQEDVVAAVSHIDARTKSIAVFYSVQFWMSSWNDYLVEAVSSSHLVSHSDIAD